MRGFGVLLPLIVPVGVELGDTQRVLTSIAENVAFQIVCCLLVGTIAVCVGMNKFPGNEYIVQKKG